MADIEMILRCDTTENPSRAAHNVDPDVLARLRRLLFEPEMRGVGYSAFINRACEVAETAIMEQRTRHAEAAPRRLR